MLRERSSQIDAIGIAPEPLHSLVSSNGPDSKYFLTDIQEYNNCFPMTSFGATKIIQENFMPTFKIQGQIYHIYVYS